MTTEQLLTAGIAAAKAKDIAEASKLLVQVVQTDPNSELGWLWLGLCRTAPQQREYCFRRVLFINPHNQDSKRQLDLLTKATAQLQVAKPLDSQSAATPVPITSLVESTKDILPSSQKTSLSRHNKKPVTQKLQRKNIATPISISIGM